MKKINVENERIKLDYQNYLRHADGIDHKTIDKKMAAIRQFEISTNCKAFRQFNKAQAMAFKDWLDLVRNTRTKARLSKATVGTVLRAVREFFRWLTAQQGFKKALGRNEWVYLKQPRKDARAAQVSSPRHVPDVAHVLKAFESMPFRTSVEKRNRALVAFLMLTGARIGAVTTLRVKHLDLERRHVFQDPREVDTKFSKPINTTFYPMGEVYVDAVVEYVNHLREDLHFGPEDALFPAIDRKATPSGFQVVGLKRTPYATTAPLRDVVKEAFALVQMPKYTPHAFRHMLMLYGDKNTNTREEFKAWSQNMGHKSEAVSVESYIPISEDAKHEIILRLAKVQNSKE
jgi:integrase